MTRLTNEENKPMQIRIAPENKAVSAQVDTMQISEREMTRILELLEHPPAPNAKLKAAITALPDSL